MREFLTLIGATLMLSVAGCGSSAMRVDTVRPDIGQVIHVDVSARTVRIAVGSFEITDPVLEHGIIGEAKTGFLNDSTDIICEQSVASILCDAFRQAIGKAGCSTVDTEDADYTLQGRIERVWVEEHATGHLPEYSKAYVKFDVLLSDVGGKTIWGHSVDIFKVSPDCFEATEYNIPTLSAALKQGVEEVVSDSTFWKAMDIQVSAVTP